MPRLVILNVGPDIAGCGIGLKRAFDRHAPDWEARAVCRGVNYLDYPTDIVWARTSASYRTRQVMQLVREADVVHVMDKERMLQLVKPALRPGQTIVVHHLGTHFRTDPARVSKACQLYGAIEVTNSIDLLLFPHIGLLPVTTDLDHIATLRARHYHRSKRIRIAHAPTNRTVAGTELIVRAVRELSDRYPIDFDLIEGVANSECLARKARADIFIDRMTLGFGLNSIECAAMGIPVVAGLSDPKARRQALRRWGRFPWADVTPATLVAELEHLITDAAYRRKVGKAGRAHAERWHSERSVVEQTLEVYGRAAERRVS